MSKAEKRPKEKLKTMQEIDNNVRDIIIEMLKRGRERQEPS